MNGWITGMIQPSSAVVHSLKLQNDLFLYLQTFWLQRHYIVFFSKKMADHRDLTHITSVGGPQGLVGPWSNSGIKAK